MLKIGLTGTIGSGKSIVAAVVARKGAGIIDADAIGHRVYRPFSPAWEQIVQRWEGVLAHNDEIDREQLGKRVFGHPEGLEALNRIMLPRMKEYIQDEFVRLERSGVQLAVLEAAILFEAGWQDLVDETWLVVSKQENIMRRLFERGLNKEDAISIIESQMPVRQKRERSNIVINNDGTAEELRGDIGTLWEARFGRKLGLERMVG